MRQIYTAIFLSSSLAIWASAASAQQPPNIFGAILNGIAVGQAKKAWDETDPAVRDCLVSRFHIAPAQLAQRAIGPSSPQVIDYVNNCRNMIAQQRAESDRAAEAEQQRQQDEAAAEEQRQRDAAAAEQERQRDLAAAEAQQKANAVEQAKAEKAAVAQKKADDAKRYAMLVQKYGSKTADAIISHSVLLGMTSEQVAESVGQPLAKQQVPPSDELWKYQADQVVFTKDRVTYVGH